MKRITLLAIATFAIAACSTVTHHDGGVLPPLIEFAGDNIHVVTAAVASPDTSPLATETKSIDPLARALTSPTFVEHATKALAMAGTSDPIFSQCVEFGLTLGKELSAQPLISVPQLAIATADPSCPLCLWEAKRRDLAAVESGAFAAQIAQVRTRVRSIHTRLVLACGPLYMDTTDVAGHAVALFGGLL